MDGRAVVLGGLGRGGTCGRNLELHLFRPSQHRSDSRIRFQVAGTRLIEGQFQDGYRILQNNEYGLVATFAISEVEKDQQQPTVGAFTVVINKGTGEFWLATVMAGQSSAVNQSVSGTCIGG